MELPNVFWLLARSCSNCTDVGVTVRLKYCAVAPFLGLTGSDIGLPPGQNACMIRVPKRDMALGTRMFSGQRSFILASTSACAKVQKMPSSCGIGYESLPLPS